MDPSPKLELQKSAQQKTAVDRYGDWDYFTFFSIRSRKSRTKFL